jgi:hypothetical protein
MKLRHASTKCSFQASCSIQCRGCGAPKGHLAWLIPVGHALDPNATALRHEQGPFLPQKEVIVRSRLRSMTEFILKEAQRGAFPVVGTLALTGQEKIPGIQKCLYKVRWEIDSRTIGCQTPKCPRCEVGRSYITKLEWSGRSSSQL